MGSPLPENTILSHCGAEATPLSPHDLVRNRVAKSSNTNDALKACPTYDDYLGLRFYHEDPLPCIKQALTICNNKQFLDDEFPVHEPGNNNNMAPKIITPENCRDFQRDGSPKRLQRIRHYRQKARQWTWIRASSILRNRKIVSSSSCSQSVIDPHNILQGSVGNCGFCSGFASLTAAWPDFISRALTFDEDCGAYSIRLFPNGRERYLLLDDHVLARDDNSMDSPSLHGISATTTDIMVRLLEKAFVKVQGSYASLDGFYKFNSLYRHPARALQLLTGAPFAVEFRFTGLDEANLYTALCATQGSCCRVAHCRKSWKGLQTNHGYSLLWVGQVQFEADNSNGNDNGTQTPRLVCLRNPHGRNSYTGKFGYGSSPWPRRMESALLSSHGDCFQRCGTTGKITWRRVEPNLVHPPALRNDIGRMSDDGIFFMEFSAFVQSFPVATVVGPIGCHSSATDVPECIYRVSDLHLHHCQTLFGG